MKIIVLTLANDEVCVCSRCKRDGRKKNYRQMVEANRKTWASQEIEGVKVYYIYGHRKGVTFPSNSKKTISNERYWPDGGAGDGFKPLDIVEKLSPFAIGDCIYSDTPEGRENLYYKTIDGFQWLLENEDFDYIYRTNCGSYIDLKILKQRVLEIERHDNIYAGKPQVYNNSHNKGQPQNIKYASGAGFLASKNLIQRIVKNRNNINLVTSKYASKTIADDVTFGKYFLYDLRGVKFINFERRDSGFSDPSVINEMHCYFDHTIEPKYLYDVHMIKMTGDK